MDESSILRRRGLQVRRAGVEIHRGQVQMWQKLGKTGALCRYDREERISLDSWLKTTSLWAPQQPPCLFSANRPAALYRVCLREGAQLIAGATQGERARKALRRRLGGRVCPPACASFAGKNSADRGCKSGACFVPAGRSQRLAVRGAGELQREKKSNSVLFFPLDPRLAPALGGGIGVPPAVSKRWVAFRPLWVLWGSLPIGAAP